MSAWLLLLILAAPALSRADSMDIGGPPQIRFAQPSKSVGDGDDNNGLGVGNKHRMPVTPEPDPLIIVGVGAITLFMVERWQQKNKKRA